MNTLKSNSKRGGANTHNSHPKHNSLMKTRILYLALFLFAFAAVSAANPDGGDGLAPGDKAKTFKLKNIDGKMMSLSDLEGEGAIVIFTCNHCPFAKKYEDEIIMLDKKYSRKGYPVVAINPNDAESYPADSYDKMIERAKEKGFTFPYLYDETQEIAKAYGALKTPHAYVLKKEGSDYVVKYVGAIDDNAYKPEKSKVEYLSDAVDALIAGKEVPTKETKAVGCGIKWK